MAKRRAMPAPNPDPAPVTNATRCWDILVDMNVMSEERRASVRRANSEEQAAKSATHVGSYTPCPSRRACRIPGHMTSSRHIGYYRRVLHLLHLRAAFNRLRGETCMHAKPPASVRPCFPQQVGAHASGTRLKSPESENPPLGRVRTLHDLSSPPPATAAAADHRPSSSSSFLFV